MILTSDELSQVVRAGGYKFRFVADIIVDGERVLQDAAVSTPGLKWSGDAKVRMTGRVVLQYSDELGTSIVPEDLTSWMTPIATLLNISVLITAGTFSEKVLLGTAKVVGVTDPTDFRKPFLGRYVSLGSSVGLQLADLFRVTDKERFPVPFGPSDTSSTWAEIGRLTLMPLSRNVPDVPISRAVTYQQNRLDAVFALATLLAGTPYVDENGRVTIDPDEWPDPDEPLGSTDEPVIISRVPSDQTDDELYNQVVVLSYDDSQSQILATAQVIEGPLRYGGPFGRVPYFASSQYVVTEQQAQAYAGRLLPQVSQQPAVQFTISTLPDPRRQVGDVVPFDWAGNSYLGRIREVNLADSGPMTLRVISRLLGPVSPPMELVFPALTLFPSLSLYPAEGI